MPIDLADPVTLAVAGASLLAVALLLGLRAIRRVMGIRCLQRVLGKLYWHFIIERDSRKRE